METNNNKSYATLIHLSALSQYFFPFGRFIFPIILWSAKKESVFIDHHGRQVINFQLSIFLYSLMMAMIAIPVLVFSVFRNVPFDTMINGSYHFGSDFTPARLTGIAIVAIIAVVIFMFLKIAEFFLLICAAVMAANGKFFEYPFTINFIGKANKFDASQKKNSTIPDQDLSTEQSHGDNRPQQA